MYNIAIGTRRREVMSDYSNARDKPGQKPYENLKIQVIDFWTSEFKFYDLCDRNLFYDKQPAKE